MGFSWNRDQEKVIESRGKDVLVSAAAGSGKTAVLVERVVRIVSDENDCVDIDSMLLVTFTKAAAREMKAKLYKALKEASEASPSNAHLRRQLTLIGNAKITTIDSFCSYVVRNWYFDLNLDPMMSIMDSTEVKIIKKQILRDVIEEALAEKNASTEELIRAFADKRDIATLIDNLLKIYEASMNAAYPKKWMDAALNLYDIKDNEELNKHPLIIEYFLHLKNHLTGVSDGIFELRSMLPDNGRFDTPRKALGEKGNYYMALEQCENISQLIECAQRKPTSKMLYKRELSQEEENLKEQIAKELSDITSRAEAVTKLKADACENLLSDMEYLRNFAVSIYDILEIFDRTFKEYKSTKGMYEFLDIEHFALDILRDQNTGEITETAKLLRDSFSYIMIDEYQDSNELQEQILTAIAKREKDRYNYFMVGDIKQSIYGFRGAEPGLFVRKLDELKDSENGEVIYLSSNYRSRDEVLKYVNAVFEKIMTKDLGGVDYDETQRLNTGREDEKKALYEAEVLYGVVDDDDIEKDELEAAIIAKRIKELMKENMSVSYMDIVILLRSPNTYGPKLKECLNRYGIPTVMDSTKGYFDRPEVMVILSILDAIDNPYNDIPLAAMLRSSLFEFSDEMLARIADKKDKKDYYYEGLIRLMEEGDEAAKAFFEKYHRLTEIADRNPIHLLLEYIYYDLGLYYDILSRYDGENAAANLEKLIEIALDHEVGESASLRGFIEYINVQKSYKEDMGLAGSTDGAKAVRIISMHTSKGLEYPYVFVAGTGKQFNEMDARAAILVDKEYGFTFDFIDKKKHISRSHIYQDAIKRVMTKKMLSEEQRILYVAMTRAREKLFITGVLKNDLELDATSEACYANSYKTKCYLKWILSADAAKTTVRYSMNEISDYLLETEKNEALTRAVIEKLLTEKIDLTSEENIRGFVYEKGKDIKTKYSVSEVKHAAYEEKLKSLDEGPSDEAKQLFAGPEEEQIRPRFLASNESASGNVQVENMGAFAGTATHRFLECFDFSLDGYQGEYDSQLKSMSDKNLLEPEQKKVLNKGYIERFLASDEARRMHEAALTGKLKAEQPFVMKVNASELGIDSSEDTLIQGIIDVFWIEKDYIVLLDYKTDRVENMDELVLRYEAQLKLYAKALEAAFDMPVKEALIYSIRLGECKNVR